MGEEEERRGRSLVVFHTAGFPLPVHGGGGGELSDENPKQRLIERCKIKGVGAEGSGRGSGFLPIIIG